jgi:NAD+ synthase (glutamine-hydrolysing)
MQTTIAVLVGSPARNPVIEGKDLFNAAFFLYEKEIKAEIHKTLLPTYDVFDEYRYFEPSFDWTIVPFKGKRLAITICEDIWNLGDNPLYRDLPDGCFNESAAGPDAQYQRFTI